MYILTISSILTIWMKKNNYRSLFLHILFIFIFQVNISIVVIFFHGRLRACEIFWCLKIYWMVFHNPHHGSSSFSNQNNISLLHWITVDRYLFLDSRLIHLISAREKHRRYLMFKIVWILTVYILLMLLI